MASRGAPSGSPDRREELERAIAQEEAGLRRLEAEQAEARVRLSALRSELAALDPVPAPASAHTAPLTAGPRTPADKVKLFRQLFRGRPDIYPTRFVSNKTGKPGYAPACSNKFVRGVCELPKVKCGDCTNQAFRPVDDAAVLAHLRGQHVMGVYAMLDDETCWFLAVDFDKRTWAEDVRAFVDTARRLGLPAVVERSRSGNGAMSGSSSRRLLRLRSLARWPAMSSPRPWHAAMSSAWSPTTGCFRARTRCRAVASGT
jgi:hypothetical protein